MIQRLLLLLVCVCAAPTFESFEGFNNKTVSKTAPNSSISFSSFAPDGPESLDDPEDSDCPECFDEPEGSNLFSIWSLFGLRRGDNKKFEPQMNLTLYYATNVTKNLKNWTEHAGYRLYYPIQVEIGGFAGNVSSLADASVGLSKVSNFTEIVDIYNKFEEFMQAMNDKVEPIFNVGGDYATDRLLEKLDKGICKLSTSMIKIGDKDLDFHNQFAKILDKLRPVYKKMKAKTKITVPDLPQFSVPK